MKLTNTTAQMLLWKCTGDEIWDVDACRNLGVPDSWIEELLDCFESGYDSDRNTVYFHDKMVNHYEGIRDRDLAFRLAEFLGIDCQRATSMALSRRAEVEWLKAELDEL